MNVFDLGSNYHYSQNSITGVLLCHLKSTSSIEQWVHVVVPEKGRRGNARVRPVWQFLDVGGVFFFFFTYYVISLFVVITGVEPSGKDGS